MAACRHQPKRLKRDDHAGYCALARRTGVGPVQHHLYRERHRVGGLARAQRARPGKARPVPRPPQEAAKAIHESYYDQLKKFNADESDFYDFRFTGQYYIDTCLQYKPCDPKPFFNEVESSFIWTENENKYSFDKLSLSLRMANAYIETKVFSKGKDKLAEVKPIFDYLISFNPTSLFVAIYNSLLITILIEEEKYTQASELIDEAFVIVAMHYSNKSDLYKKIVLQKNLLKQKSYL